MRATTPTSSAAGRGSRRGSPQLRLRVGFVVIAMALSVFGARLVQLQGLDPNAYAAMAAAEGLVEAVLPAERGEILDRNGEPLADSVDGLMIVADPELTREQAPALAKFLYQRLDVDYATTLKQLREPGQPVRVRRPAGPGGARRPRCSPRRPSGGLRGPGHRARPGPRLPGRRRGRQPGRLHGHRRAPGRLRAHLRRASSPARTARPATRSAAATGSRSGRTPSRRPVDGTDLTTTIDLDLQWYTQRVLRQTVEDARRRLGLRRRHGQPHRRAPRRGRRPDVRRQRRRG